MTKRMATVSSKRTIQYMLLLFKKFSHIVVKFFQQFKGIRLHVEHCLFLHVLLSMYQSHPRKLVTDFFFSVETKYTSLG